MFLDIWINTDNYAPRNKVLSSIFSNTISLCLQACEHADICTQETNIFSVMHCHCLVFGSSTAVHCRVCQDQSGCSDRGECVLGVCQCETGVTGENCETGEYLFVKMLVYPKYLLLMTISCYSFIFSSFLQ